MMQYLISIIDLFQHRQYNLMKMLPNNYARLTLLFTITTSVARSLHIYRTD